MKIIEKALNGLLVLEPKCFTDERGWFMETYRQSVYADLGITDTFLQDNVSFSTRGVLRGLHFQNPNPQGKLVSVVQGSVFDVGVDLRRQSPTFGQWFGTTLTSENHRQLWLPAGFAHGFLTLSETALFSYKCTDVYSPSSEKSLLWNDPEVGIQWPHLPHCENQVSPKDSLAKTLSHLTATELFP